VRKLSEKFKNLSDFSKEIYNDLYNFMLKMNGIEKRTNDQIKHLTDDSNNIIIRIEKLESAFKNLVVDESLLIKEEIKNLQLKKNNIWSNTLSAKKSIDKYNYAEKILVQRNSIYEAAQKF
jgi:hypothetical protein